MSDFTMAVLGENGKPIQSIIIWTGSFQGGDGATYVGWIWKAMIYAFNQELTGYLNGQVLNNADGSPFGTFIGFNQNLNDNDKIQIKYPKGSFDCVVTKANKTVGEYPLHLQKVSAPQQFPGMTPEDVKKHEQEVERMRQKTLYEMRAKAPGMPGYQQQ